MKNFVTRLLHVCYFVARLLPSIDFWWRNMQSTVPPKSVSHFLIRSFFGFRAPLCNPCAVSSSLAPIWKKGIGEERGSTCSVLGGLSRSHTFETDLSNLERGCRRVSVLRLGVGSRTGRLRPFSKRRELFCHCESNSEMQTSAYTYDNSPSFF
jgi:hypothetical protein